MSIIVTANKAQYQLLNHSAHNFASTQATALKPFQFEKLVPQLSPKKPENWEGIVENLFPAESRQLNEESVIKTKILEALGNGKMRMVPFSSIKTGSSRGTGGGNSSGSNASNFQSQPLSNAEKGQTNPPQQNANTATQDELSNQSPAPVNNGSKQGVPPVADTCTNGCPISMITGEELLQIDDAVLPGPVPFKWTRTYRSSFNDTIGLGYGWTHSASERLFFGETSIEYYDSEARCILFKRPEVGQTSRYLPEGLSLERPSEFSFILKQKGEHDKVFTAVSGKSPFYRLTQIRHAHYLPAKSHKEPAKGFAISLHYNSGGQLSWLEGSWGKSFLVSRDDSGRIVKVELSDQASEQRKIVAEYEYRFAVWPIAIKAQHDI